MEELTGLFILILIMSGEGGTPGLYGWGGRREIFEEREGVVFLGGGGYFSVFNEPCFFFFFLFLL